MGRIFEVRKHTMFARWNRMAKQFARIGKDITIAVRSGGTDPASNPTLRRVIQNARSINMPMDKVESAIKRASGRDAADYTEIIYEGYAPHGVAILIDVLTDNRNRTGSDIRTALKKNGGSIAEPGAVSWQFERKGVVIIPVTAEEDDVMMAALDAGADDYVTKPFGMDELFARLRAALRRSDHAAPEAPPPTPKTGRMTLGTQRRGVITMQLLSETPLGVSDLLLDAT